MDDGSVERALDAMRQILLQPVRFLYIESCAQCPACKLGSGTIFEIARHVGRECPLPRELVFPKLVDYDEDAGAFLYDRAYESETPQWTERWTGSQGAER